MLYTCRKWLLPLILILFGLFFVSGCGKSGTSATTAPEKTQTATSSQPSQNQNTSPTPAATEQKVRLYFPNPDATGLVAVDRTVKVSDGSIIQAVINQLQTPPSGLVYPLPQGTKLLGASVKNGVATLNFSQEFQKNFTGGSTGEQMTLYSIIDSLTTLPNIQSFQFLLDGQIQVAILGNTDTTQPLKPDQTLILK